MNKKFRTIIKEVLAIIEYQGNKEDFSDKFYDAIYKKAFVNLYKDLPEDKQKNLDVKLNSEGLDNAESIIKEFFPKDKFSDKLQKTSQEIIEEYLEGLRLTLTKDQNRNLNSYFNSL